MEGTSVPPNDTGVMTEACLYMGPHPFTFLAPIRWQPGRAAARMRPSGRGSAHETQHIMEFFAVCD